MEHTTPIWRIAREEPILFGICLCSSHEICMLCAALLRSFVLQPCNLHAMCNTSASAGRNPRRFLLCGSENFFYLAVNTAAGLPIDEFSNVAMRNTGCPKHEHPVAPDVSLRWITLLRGDIGVPSAAECDNCALVQARP